MYDNPLSFFKIPGLEALVKPISDYLGYTYLPTHISEIVLAAAFYQAAFILSSALSPVLLPAYKNLSPKTKVNFDIHVVSHIQAILILALSFPLFNDPVLSTDRLSAYTPYAGFVSACAVGYFVWDTYVCIKYFKLFGFGFLLHGVAALFVFSQSTRPLLLYYSPHFILFELSTPFLNINWFASHLPEGTISFAVQKINGLFLLSTFFGVRIVWGFYQASRVAVDLLATTGAERSYPLWSALGVLAANVSLDFLNVFWFYKMFKLAKRAISSGSGRAVSKKRD